MNDQLARVALVARALTTSMRQSEIVDIVVRQGMAGLDAEGGVLALVAPDGLVVPVATVGYPSEAVAAFAPMTVGQELPLTVAAREREAVWVRSPAEAAARFPALVAAAVTTSQAWVAIPLVVDDAVFGVLGVSFLAPREFSESERMFIQALGDQCALALAAQRGRRLGVERSADGAIRTLVVRGHVGSGLEIGRTLRADPRFAVSECDAPDTFSGLTRTVEPDLVVIAGHLPEASPIVLVGPIRTQWPHATLVVLTSDPAVEARALHLGADAVFGMSVPAGWLQAALTTLVEASRPGRGPDAGLMPTQAGASAGPPRSLDAHALSSAMFDTSLDAVMFTAPDGLILAANPAACRMFGMSEEEICRRGRSGLTDPDDPRWVSALREREATGQFFGELSMLRADGTAFPVEVSSAVFENAEGGSRTVVVLRDVSARKETEALLTRRACVDELTGALNRRGFLDVALERLRRAHEAGSAMTLLFVDLDGLKGLNDHWGYATGDAALQETAELLRGACRADDLVARFGGDEFVVLLQPLPGETPTTLATRVENRVHLRNAQGPPFPLRISVGVAQVDVDDAMTIEPAIAEAHSAMREARIRAGRGRSHTRAR